MLLSGCTVGRFLPDGRRVDEGRWQVKIKTVKVCEGELIGPIDWSFDFDSASWKDGCGGVNPEVVKNSVEVLKQIKVGDTIQGAYGDEPRKVLAIGMYDGWPFWRPYPSVLVEGPHGHEWHAFTYLRSKK
jgi:hypothetical protein